MFCGRILLCSAGLLENAIVERRGYITFVKPGTGHAHKINLGVPVVICMSASCELCHNEKTTEVLKICYLSQLIFIL